MYNDYKRHDFCPTDSGYPNDHHCPASCCPCPTLTPIRGINTRFSSTGSIIPFSSGIVPVALTTVLGGLISTTSIVGFGTSAPGVAIVGNTLPFLPPALTGVLAIGTNVNGIVTLSEPVTAQTRLLLAFYAVSTGFSIATAIVRNASAGVAIR